MASAVGVLSIEELNKLTRNTKNETPEGRYYETLGHAQQLWSDLLATVHDPSVSERHMTAACNAICFVARKCLRSTSDEVRSFSLSRNTWRQAFDAARCAFATGKNKPALQVLDTLAYLAEANLEKELVTMNVGESATEMVKIVFNQRPKKSLKEACIVLYFFLKKLSDFMCFSDVLQQAFQKARLNFSRLYHAHGIKKRTVDRQTDSEWFAFVLSLLMAIRVAESRSATLKLLSLLSTLSVPGRGIDLVGLMNEAIEVYSAADETALEDVSRDVLPSILTSSERYHKFLAEQTDKAASSEPAVQVALALLEFGKRQGFVHQDELPTLINAILFKSCDQSHSGFNKLLSNASAAIRLRTCELVTSSVSPKVPVPTAALTCLANSLHLLHDDTDAFHRGELLSTFRRFLKRLRLSRSVLDRTSQSGQLSNVDEFLYNYTAFLRAELAPQLSYGRHILALDIICFIAETSVSGDLALPRPIMADRTLLRSLFRLILDPYDDVRTTAAQALSYAKVLGVTEPAVTTTFKDVVDTLKPIAGASTLAAATNRGDHADALGRIIGLMHPAGTLDSSEVTNGSNKSYDSEIGLQSLVQQFCAYIKSVEAFDTSAQYPLHGNILGISYIVRAMKSGRALSLVAVLQENLLGACQRVWKLSQTYLCVDSPEMEVEPTDEAASLGPKDALAYAWRALRDSNLLMQAILESLAPDMRLLESIGSMCFEQLALLRHRGAFSTVAQTFVFCSHKARNSEDTQTQALIGHWFGRALDELERQADKLTRRSAGLPAMFIALLHPHDHEQFLTSFEALAKIAIQVAPQGNEASSQDRLRLPQVHALNCIKDIMTASRFRIMTEPLVVSTINMATKCMGSPIWAIKNCGLMLLRASISRLDPDTTLGASEAGLSQREASSPTITPFDIALALLEKDVHQARLGSGLQQEAIDLTEVPEGNAEAEFAGLDLLGRLLLREHERTMAKKAVTRKLGHELWHIRAQAARLLSDLTLQGQESTALCEVLSDFASHTSVNEGHGRFLVAQNLLPRMHDDLQIRENLTRIVGLLVDVVATSPVNKSSMVAAMWLALATILSEYASNFPGEQMKLYIAFKQRMLSMTRSSEQANALFDRACALFIVSTRSAIEFQGKEKFFSKLMNDEDVTLHVFSHTQSSMLTGALNPANTLWRPATSGQTSYDVRAAALSVSSSLLPSSDLAPHEAIQLMEFNPLISRDLRNAQLRFYACLAGQIWSKQSENDLLKLKASANNFCIHLRAAANDELEDTTRKAAIEALEEWRDIQSVPEMLDRLLGSAGKLEVMSVLYDLLNDDDDEIRSAAAGVTARLLTQTCQAAEDDTLRATDVLCAAASRQRLRRQLLYWFGETETLRLECWRRVLGIKMNVARSRLGMAIAFRLERDGVSQQLYDILAAANDLFAEEKPNLYVDDVNELKVWAEMLVKTAFDVSDSVPTAKSWVSDGLQDLTSALLKRELGSSMHYSADFERLMIRVITVARIIGVFKAESHDLQELCISANMSETVLLAFTRSLK